MQQTCQEHWEATLGVVPYMKSCSDQGLFLSVTSSLTLTAYCDAAWSSFLVTRHSVISYFIFLGDSPVPWKMKKQPTISCSLAKMEYCSMDVTRCELQCFWKFFLYDLQIPRALLARLHCNSQEAMHIVANHVYHERTKHIQVDYHFFSRWIFGSISLTYVPFVSTGRHLHKVSDYSMIFFASWASKIFILQFKVSVKDWSIP